MTRADAEELVRLLAILEADPMLPSTLRNAVTMTRGVALSRLMLAEVEQHSVKVPTPGRKLRAVQ